MASRMGPRLLNQVSSWTKAGELSAELSSEGFASLGLISIREVLTFFLLFSPQSESSRKYNRIFSRAIQPFLNAPLKIRPPLIVNVPNALLMVLLYQLNSLPAINQTRACALR